MIAPAPAHTPSIAAMIGFVDPGETFLDVVLDVLGKIEPDADEFTAELVLQLGDELVLGHARRPFRRTA